MSISPAMPVAPVPRTAADTKTETALFGPSGFGFQAVVDTLNPLQHLPVVSTFFREATGEGIGAIPRLLGGGLFGGLVGLIGSAINLVVEGLTGKDIGDHVMAAFDSQADTQVVQRDYATENYRQAAMLSAETLTQKRCYELA